MMTTTSMASAIATSSKSLCQSSIVINKPIFYCLSTSSHSIPNSSILGFSWNHQLGLTSFYQWTGLRHSTSSISLNSINLGKKRKCRNKGVCASLFGVGAPEALVIGVVALLVFGPKGLAEVARTLGKTLRAFQPTIRELQDVSRDFKSTLEQEIGLDDIQRPIQNNSTSTATNRNSSPSVIATSEDSQTKVDPIGSPSTNNGYSSEDLLKITEKQLKAIATESQKQIPELGENQSEPQTQPQDIAQEAAEVVPPPKDPKSET